MVKDAVTELDPEAPTYIETRSFELELVEGNEPRLQGWQSKGPRTALGSHPSNELELQDRKVSRFHAEILLDERGARLRDLGSRNGTFLDGVPIESAWLREGSVIKLGGVELRFRSVAARVHIPLSRSTQFGSLVGRSAAMREVFAQLERAAPTDSSVLLLGDTGTGKEHAARAVHERSPRGDGPFVVVDCAGLPTTLLESELFGHEKGAFTGAVRRHVGAFEAAHGGTVFLDEIGELPLDVQPKLLGVLERRTVRLVGTTKDIPVDVRVIAATHRNLRREVNEGKFRADLYYRLAVIPVRLPSLRERPEDLGFISESILARLGAPPDVVAELLSEESLARMRGAAWPGNVRELRNFLERRVILRDTGIGAIEAPITPQGGIIADPRMSYESARQAALHAFERQYLALLLELHGNNVSAAARAADMSRNYLYELLQRHGLR